MSELEGQHFIGKSFWNDDGVELVSIHDENGMWVLDCFESGAEEILKRINGYEQFQRTNKELLEALNNVVFDYVALQKLDGHKESGMNRSVAEARNAITNAKQQAAKD